MRIRILTSFAVVSAAALAIAGCGSSSSNAPITVAHQARPTPKQSNADIGSAPAQTSHFGAAQSSHNGLVGATAVGGVASHDRIGPQTVEKARPTPGTANDDQNTSSAGGLNPCTLVSLAQAQTLTSGAVTARVEAPLGPTCIYRKAGSASAITLAVESQSFAQTSRQMRTRSHVTVAGHHGYCGRLGTQVLVVPLAHGQLLNVTAPCATAQRFAALAISRLEA